jgi:nucleoside phosphorylase
VSVLVVAAWEPELERFRTLAPERAITEPVGIGLVDASLGSTRLLLEHAPTLLVMIGTCGGAPGSGLSIGDVVVATRTRLVDAATVAGRAAMPFGSDAIALDEPMIEAAATAGARRASVVNTLGVTTDDELAMKLAALGDVEHLESYGVARACQTANVACAIVLGVANIVGARGRDEWRANHREASARAAEIAARALRTSTTARSPA